jgi:uncharacterized DUF497 family protein
VSGAGYEFERDSGNLEHIARHDVSVAEVESLFQVPRYEEPELVNEEERLWALGVTERGRCLTVVYTVRSGRIRVVTAHPANRSSRRFYEEIVVGRRQQE